MVAGYAVGLLMANMAVYVMAMGQVSERGAVWPIISLPVGVGTLMVALASSCRRPVRRLLQYGREVA